MRSVRGEALRSTSRNPRNSSTSRSPGPERDSFRLLGFFDLVPVVTRVAVLAFEDRRWVGRDQLVTLQDKFRINAVAGRFLDFVAAEPAVKPVLVVVVVPKIHLLGIRREFLVFVQHYQLSCSPRLAWPAHVPPKMVILFVVA